MKIAIWHNLPSGGGKRALYEQVRGLVARGHVVEAWCPSTADQTYLPLSDLIIEHILPLDWEPQTPVQKWTRLPGPYPFLLRKLAAVERHCRACAAQMEARNMDVLLAHPCGLFRTSPLARFCRLPSVLYLQEPFRALYEAQPRLPWVASDTDGVNPTLRHVFQDAQSLHAVRVQAREERRCAAEFDRILVNSRFSRESVLRAYGLDARVCYLGVDAALFRPTGAAKEGYVVGLGAVDTAKGADRALAALATLPASRRPALVWVGNYSNAAYQEQVEAQARALDVEFIVKTHLTDAALVDVLSRATALIYTSRLEPFGFAPLEAGACGTPVVAVAEGGVRETVRHGINGLLVDDDDPAALGAALLSLVDDPGEAARMGVRAREDVLAHWQWGAAVDALESHLRVVAGAGQTTDNRPKEVVYV